MKKHHIVGLVLSTLLIVGLGIFIAIKAKPSDLGASILNVSDPKKIKPSEPLPYKPGYVSVLANPNGGCSFWEWGDMDGSAYSPVLLRYWQGPCPIIKNNANQNQPVGSTIYADMNKGPQLAYLDASNIVPNTISFRKCKRMGGHLEQKKDDNGNWYTECVVPGTLVTNIPISGTTIVSSSNDKVLIADNTKNLADISEKRCIRLGGKWELNFSNKYDCHFPVGLMQSIYDATIGITEPITSTLITKELDAYKLLVLKQTPPGGVPVMKTQ